MSKNHQFNVFWLYKHNKTRHVCYGALTRSRFLFIGLLSNQCKSNKLTIFSSHPQAQVKQNCPQLHQFQEDLCQLVTLTV